MGNSRTEEDKLCQAPLVVVLGGQKYDVKPLVIKDSRQWRKDVVAALSPLLKNISIEEVKSEELVELINQTMSSTPDTIIDLFFGYAKSLNQEEIEAVATDMELATAFGQVVDIAFPLVKSLVETMAKLSQ